MKVLFLGGDKRQLEIINNLKEKNYEIDLVGYENKEILNVNKIIDIDVSKYDMIFFPVNGVKCNFNIWTDYGKDVTLNADFLVNTKENVKIFTGIKTKELDQMLVRADRKAICLMDDIEVKKENGEITAEGIIADLIENTEYALKDSSVFIIGYGCVGKALVRRLVDLKSTVTVGIIDISQYEQLAGHIIKCVYTNDFKDMKKNIVNHNIIVNTVPELILNREYLELLNKEVYILDISSSPHGVDYNSATELKIKHKLLLGIPGNVAPKSAGNILVKKINTILREDKNV